MNTVTFDSHFNSNQKTISYVYNELMSNTLFRSTTTWNSTKTFVFPAWQYYTINLVRRCPMYKVTGFVGHNERISIKCSKCGASFVIKRTTFCCSYTVIQFVNIQMDYSSTHRHNFQTTLFCLFLTYVMKPDAYGMLTCHPKNIYIYILWHTNNLCMLCSTLLLFHLQQHCNHCCRPPLSATIFF
jgi:hypothetical protein